MKKLVYFIGIPVVVVLLAVFIGTWFFLSRVLNENFLVQQIESSLNVRADVKKLNVSLFSIMSSIELDGVSLAARDSFANAGAELSTRPPIANPVLSIGKVDLKF